MGNILLRAKNKEQVGDKRDGPVSQAVLKAPVAEVRDLISTGAG